MFKRRLHTVSLLVFRADGLRWANTGLVRMGRINVDVQASRGFSVLLWRDGDAVYCLVSDVNRHDLEALAVKVAG